MRNSLTYDDDLEELDEEIDDLEDFDDDVD